MKQRQWRPQITRPEMLRGWVFFAVYVGVFPFLMGFLQRLLLRAGERCPAHEFHYWDATENGDALRADKAGRGESWRCGYAGPDLYATFPHLHFGGPLPLARRFADAARRTQREGKGWS